MLFRGYGKTTSKHGGGGTGREWPAMISNWGLLRFLWIMYHCKFRNRTVIVDFHDSSMTISHNKKYLSSSKYPYENKYIITKRVSYWVYGNMEMLEEK